MKTNNLLRCIILLCIIISVLSCEEPGSTETPSTEALPVDKAAGIIFYNTDYDSGQIGGRLVIIKAVDESSFTHYCLYWGTDSSTKTGTAIEEFAKTGENIEYAIPADTSITGSHLLVFTRNSSGEMSECAGFRVTDKPSAYRVTSDYEGLADVDACDIDSDGDIDLFAAGGTSGAIEWWENLGNPLSGAWTLHTFDYDIPGISGTPTIDRLISVKLADIDADGLTDIIGMKFYADAGLIGLGMLEYIVWWENDGTADSNTWNYYAFELASGITVQPSFLNNIIDVNNDSRPDICIDTGELCYLANDGTPEVDGWMKYGLGDANDTSVSWGDVNNDNYQDLILGTNIDTSTSNLIVLLNDGTASMSSWISDQSNIGMISTDFTGISSVNSADIDGDGDLDVVASSDESNTITWWKNEGIFDYFGTWTGYTIDSNFTSASSVFISDIDSDGDIDILGIAGAEDTIRWYENDGTPAAGLWPKHTITTTAEGINDLCFEDIDNDGALDIVASTLDAQSLSWWKIF